MKRNQDMERLLSQMKEKRYNGTTCYVTTPYRYQNFNRTRRNYEKLRES